MDSSPSNAVLLMLDDVRRTKRERDSIALEIDRLTGELTKLDAKLDGIKHWLSPELEAQVFSDDVEIEENGTAHPQSRKWAPVILPIFREAGPGLLQKEVKEKLKAIDSPLYFETGLQGGALYNALSKMVKKGELVRDGNYFCLPGQGKPDNSVRSNSRKDYEEAIISVLKERPDGLKSSMLIEKLKKTTVGENIIKSSGYVFKVLSWMLEINSISKDGQRYFYDPENIRRDTDEASPSTLPEEMLG